MWSRIHELSENRPFLEAFCSAFPYRGRPDACEEQEMLSRLKKRAKINLSIFSV
jgi:hypothetical protein